MKNWSTLYERGTKKNSDSLTGIEHMTSRTPGGRSIRWATRFHEFTFHIWLPSLNSLFSNPCYYTLGPPWPGDRTSEARSLWLPGSGNWLLLQIYTSQRLYTCSCMSVLGVLSASLCELTRDITCSYHVFFSLFLSCFLFSLAFSFNSILCPFLSVGTKYQDATVHVFNGGELQISFRHQRQSSYDL